jgi:hypothetical protein
LSARSAPAGQPLIARLAAEMTSLRQNCQENSGLHRCFRGVTWLWAGISRLLAVIFAVLVATVPMASFLLISCLAVTGTGAAASALWFFAVLCVTACVPGSRRADPGPSRPGALFPARPGGGRRLQAIRARARAG